LPRVLGLLRWWLAFFQARTPRFSNAAAGGACRPFPASDHRRTAYYSNRWRTCTHAPRGRRSSWRRPVCTPCPAWDRSRTSCCNSRCRTCTTCPPACTSSSRPPPCKPFPALGRGRSAGYSNRCRTCTHVPRARTSSPSSVAAVSPVHAAAPTPDRPQPVQWRPREETRDGTPMRRPESSYCTVLATNHCVSGGSSAPGRGTPPTRPDTPAGTCKHTQRPTFRLPNFLSSSR
jgi:hypothetical protein